MKVEGSQGGIYWLASYPKSGNTWMRAFIAGLTGEKDEVDINVLETGEIASSYGLVEEALGFEISELSQEEIDRYRPHAYRWIARQMKKPEYHKIHDAYTYLPEGEPLIPPEATRGALYIVRNPLDVAISFAHHSHCSIDQSIMNMGNPTFAFCAGKKRLHNQLRQKLLSWSDHVKSWLDAPGLNRLMIRYEDMQGSPLETFSRAARFLGLPDDELSVSRALESCKMEKLQRQEAEKGFKEKMPLASSFFRKGIVGDWVETLTTEQVRALLKDHGDMMTALGYLDDAGRLIDPVMATHQVPQINPLGCGFGPP